MLCSVYTQISPCVYMCTYVYRCGYSPMAMHMFVPICVYLGIHMSNYIHMCVPIYVLNPWALQ